jgi:LacI family transcriptional regulator
MTFGMEELLLEDLKLRNVPLVFVDVGPPRPHVSNIRIDYLNGIRQAVQHLAALRHERIAFITGPLRLPSAVARKNAFVHSMREIGLEVDKRLVIEGDHTSEGGMAALAQLLEANVKPTAVLCSNDMTAIGVMRKSYERRITIPRDLSLVGFDDIRLAQFMLPPLTTVQMSQAKLARLAFNALLADVQREVPAPNGTGYELRTNLVLRESTGLAPHSAWSGKRQNRTLLTNRISGKIDKRQARVLR